MAMFSEASRELANQLRQSASSEDPQESESVEMDVNGNLIFKRNTHGKTSRVKPPLGHSSSLGPDQLTISMNRGTEVSIPADSLAEGSLALAKNCMPCPREETRNSLPWPNKEKR